MNPTSKYLSKREQEVVELLLKGKSNKQIALALGIAESTVEFHLKNVYAKLKVNSRAEAILKLGKSTGLTTENLRESIVERKSEINHTSGKFILEKRGFVPSTKNASLIRKDVEMKNRLFYYSLAGVIFGMAYWYYLGAAFRFLSTINIDKGNPLLGWVLLSLGFLIYFGVWLIPVVLPATYEFRRSRSLIRSTLAVIMVWVSAVLGLFLMIVFLFVGLPNIQFFLVFGQYGAMFWENWTKIFPKLLLFTFVKWTLVAILISSLAGLVMSWLCSIWVKRHNTMLPT